MSSKKLKEAPEWLANILAPQFAEEATGIRQRGRQLGPFSAGPINRDGFVSIPGHDLSDEKALDYLLEGGSVSVPNAGAGSYREFFTRMKFTQIKVVNHTSSAGDWCFGVEDEGTWTLAFQSNRYPRPGFDYSVDREMTAESFETLCDYAQG